MTATTTTAARIAALESEVRTLAATEIAVETNEGTWGPQEAGRKVGTSQPEFANYTVYETVGGASRRVGCNADRAPGYARRLGADEMAQARKRLAELKAQLREARSR